VSKRARQIAKKAEETGEILKDKPVKVLLTGIAQKKIKIIDNKK
jgi:DNA-directed RNA polymerase subunit K/omega